MFEKAYLFEKAVKGKYRFPHKGMITTEDLNDLSIVELNTIFQKLNSQAKLSKEESLLDIKSEEDKILDSQIELIKYIVEQKKQETENRKTASERAEKKQKLLEILDRKRNADLESKSTEDLEKMINGL